MALGIEDLAVGHWTDPVGLTGCTVVVPPPGNVAAAAVRGGGPGTRETDLLQPQAHVEGVSAVLLTGGSAFGLAAAQGVVAWCERRGLGYGRFGRPIPIVPAAVLFDLAVGDWEVRPGPAEGEAACLAASTAEGPLGNVGAGMGATVGKTAGPEHMTKGGLGWAVVEAGPVTVGALAAVNAGGDVLNEDGTVLAGARVPGGARTALRELLTAPATDGEVRPEPVPPGGSTTLGVVATNATLTKG
ncbi:MAG TPA: P1 family peptidase, partial [Actinomycetota bacterium]|nr:P1 family peptidase [Actinomycetota bacterium]